MSDNNLFFCDFHTHSLLSDGALIPSELVRRYIINGFNAVAITDHADSSNIEVIVKSLVCVCNELNKYWPIKVLPGVELTHIPVEQFLPLTKYARKKGAKIVVAHGESPVEPVVEGTNRAAINAGVDILAHPGYISKEDVEMAYKKDVYLEITLRKGHSLGNKHVFNLASKFSALLVINSDSHSPDDIPTRERLNMVSDELGILPDNLKSFFTNSENLLKRIKILT